MWKSRVDGVRSPQDCESDDWCLGLLKNLESR